MGQRLLRRAGTGALLQVPDERLAVGGQRRLVVDDRHRLPAVMNRDLVFLEIAARRGDVFPGRRQPGLPDEAFEGRSLVRCHGGRIERAMANQPRKAARLRELHLHVADLSAIVSDGDADLLPRGLDRLFHGGAEIRAAGHLHRQLGAIDELARRGELHHRLEPDPSGHVPRVPLHRLGEQHKGAVGDARIDVDAAAIERAGEELAHVRRLGIGAKVGVVHKPRSGILHVADGPPGWSRHEDFRADQPAGLERRLAILPLSDQHAEHVGEVFVERAGLVAVFEVAGERLDAVRELVADDIQRAGEALEDDAVPVAVGHLLAVPERVVHRDELAGVVRLRRHGPWTPTSFPCCRASSGRRPCRRSRKWNRSDRRPR